MKEIIDEFVPSLVKHLTDEIDIFLELDWLDSDGLRKAWDVGEEAAKGKGKLSILVSLL